MVLIGNIVQFKAGIEIHFLMIDSIRMNVQELVVNVIGFSSAQLNIIGHAFLNLTMGIGIFLTSASL